MPAIQLHPVGGGHRRPTANRERRARKTEHPTLNIQHPTSSPKYGCATEKPDETDLNKRACSKSRSGRGSMVPGYVQGGTRAPPDQPEGGGRGRLYLGCLWWIRNIEHRTSNIEHPTPNIQHPTPNIQHPTSNEQCLSG
jgi:hypothetical protein